MKTVSLNFISWLNLKFSAHKCVGFCHPNLCMKCVSYHIGFQSTGDVHQWWYYFKLTVRFQSRKFGNSLEMIRIPNEHGTATQSKQISMQHQVKIVHFEAVIWFCSPYPYPYPHQYHMPKDSNVLRDITVQFAFGLVCLLLVFFVFFLFARSFLSKQMARWVDVRFGYVVSD